VSLVESCVTGWTDFSVILYSAKDNYMASRCRCHDDGSVVNKASTVCSVYL
jgi:hypothetical protein